GQIDNVPLAPSLTAQMVVECQADRAFRHNADKRPAFVADQASRTQAEPFDQAAKSGAGPRVGQGRQLGQSGHVRAGDGGAAFAHAVARLALPLREYPGLVTIAPETVFMPPK